MVNIRLPSNYAVLNLVNIIRTFHWMLINKNLSKCFRDTFLHRKLLVPELLINLMLKYHLKKVHVVIYLMIVSYCSNNRLCLFDHN